MAEIRKCRRCFRIRCENMTAMAFSSIVKAMELKKSITRIPNGYDAGEVEAVGGLKPASDRFRILHAGMLTQNRSAVPFLRGLKLFLADRAEAAARISVSFVGPREDKNEAAVRELGLGDVVEFMDAVSHEETLKLEKRAHILLLIKHVNPDYDGLVPGKLYEYIGVGRPILALVPDGEAKQRIQDLRRGEVVGHDDPRSIAGKISGLYDRFVDGTLDSAFDLSAQPGLERENLAGELARLLDGLAGSKHEQN